MSCNQLYPWMKVPITSVSVDETCEVTGKLFSSWMECVQARRCTQSELVTLSYDARLRLCLQIGELEMSRLESQTTISG